jgi:hypothetical protein
LELQGKGNLDGNGVLITGVKLNECKDIKEVVVEPIKGAKKNKNENNSKENNKTEEKSNK